MIERLPLELFDDPDDALANKASTGYHPVEFEEPALEPESVSDEDAVLDSPYLASSRGMNR